MTAPACNTCFHHRLDAQDRDRCTRIQHRRGGLIQKRKDGFNCTFERDSVPEPQRVDGDKCGPTGIHWASKE